MINFNEVLRIKWQISIGWDISLSCFRRVRGELVVQFDANFLESHHSSLSLIDNPTHETVVTRIFNIFTYFLYLQL